MLDWMNDINNLFDIVQSSIEGINGVLYKMTTLFGFSYQYTPYVSLRTFLIVY